MLRLTCGLRGRQRLYAVLLRNRHDPLEVRLDRRRWIRRILDLLSGFLYILLDEATGRLHDQHPRLCVADILESVWRTARCEQ